MRRPFPTGPFVLIHYLAPGDYAGPAPGFRQDAATLYFRTPDGVAGGHITAPPFHCADEDGEVTIEEEITAVRTLADGTVYRWRGRLEAGVLVTRTTERGGG